MPTKNELPRPRYPVDYSQLTPRGVKRTIPQWNTPDLNRGFADSSDEPNTRDGRFAQHGPFCAPRLRHAGETPAGVVT
jgi:hypothetical protein